MGNNYVSDVLVSRLNDLAKMKKVVVVATHNANVAVRTMPYRSILKVYDNGEYKTFIGNPYVNKLVNIKDENDYKDWKEESIRILEGGKEAFEENEKESESESDETCSLEEYEYIPDNPLLLKVKVRGWPSRYTFFKQFRDDAKRLFDISSSECRHEPYFSYI